MSNIITRVRLMVATILALLIGGFANAAGDNEWSTVQQEIVDIVAVLPIGLDRDFEGWVAGFHPDWTYWEVGTDNLRTLSEQVERVRKYVASGAQVLDFQAEPKYVAVQGDTALIRYDAVETIRESVDTTVEVRFSTVDVFLRVEGIWKLYSTNIQYLN